MTKTTLYFIIAILAMNLPVNAQYFPLSDAPNATKFLPGPPKFTSTRFSTDIEKYFIGKDIQKYDPIRAAQIKEDVPYGGTALASTFAPSMGYTINASTAPQQWTLLANSMFSIAYGTDIPKAYFARVRPCVKFNESPYSTETLTSLKKSYSYPSSHTMSSWGIGIVIAALNPTKQDSILSRAYQYGQSRIYGGMHWQSDVIDARFIASAGVARLLANNDFKSGLSVALNEANRMLPTSLGITIPNYDAEDYYAPENMPNFTRIYPAPSDMNIAGTDQAYDLSQYVWGKSMRETERGEKAQFDTSDDLDVIVNEFAHAIVHTIDSIQTPAIYRLIKFANEATENCCKIACDTYNRERPYTYFKEEPFVFEDMSSSLENGSYPSIHASRAWTTALMITAIAPALQDTILKVGYELGQSCVISGINWQSDVDAGRFASGLALSRMLSNPHFMPLVTAAQEEYRSKTQYIVTDEMDLPIDKIPNKPKPTLYTIEGKAITNDYKGIAVGQDLKTIIK